MSKSRSNEDKDRDKERDKEKEREKEQDSQDEEAAQDGTAEEDVTRQRTINQLQLNSETEADVKSPTLDTSGAMLRNEAAIPNSPPPSYEHVLEQTRLEQEAEAQMQEEEAQERQEVSWVEKSTGTSTQKAPAKGPEILHKSSKEFYRAVAKQWGITCKMSDRCRCFDCQSHYFDCEYDKNEHQKTDGGLGAGTPMFISEVMQGTACVLL